MRHLRALLLALPLLAAPVVMAQELDGPAYGSEAYADEREALFAALKSAESELEARAAEDAIWAMWFRGPSYEIGERMDDASQRLRWGEYDAAREILDGILVDAPGYSEAYNQRAFAYFLMGNYEESLADIDRTLDLEPNHFGALSGQAQIFIRQSLIEKAIGVVREATKIHPWLRERYMLPESERIDGRPEGEEL
ncbi:MAG: tetratricopeptide repeat protein [Pseudomonadota bacterium]